MDNPNNNLRWLAIAIIMATLCGLAFFVMWPSQEEIEYTQTTPVSSNPTPEPTTPQVPAPTPTADIEEDPIPIDEESDTNPSVVITGTVWDKDNRTPVPNIKVQLYEKGEEIFFFSMWGSSQAETVTDEQGTYTFSNIESGAYTVFADGRTAGYVANGSDGQAIDFDSTKSKTDVDVWLAKGGTVEGRVLNSSGEPIENALVLVMPADPSADMLGFGFGVSDDPDLPFPKTSASGGYSVKGLEFGSPVRVTAKAEGYAIARSESITLTKASPLAQTDLTVTNGSRVSGKVTYEDGAPTEGQFVAITVGMTDLMAGKLMNPETAQSDANGEFVFEHVAAGDYLMTLVEDEDDVEMFEVAETALASPESTNKVEVDGFNGVTGLAFVVKRKVVGTGRVTGIILAVDGSPAADIEISAMNKSDYEDFETTSDANGHFSFNELTDGYYDLVGYNENGSVHSSRVTLGSHVTLQMLASLKVTGRVIDADGNPVPNARVNNQEPDGFDFDYGAVNTDANGEAILEDVEEGETILTASSRTHGNGVSETFVVKRGRETPVITITLVPGVNVSGVVVDPEGNPVPGANVSLLAAQSGMEDMMFMSSMFQTKVATANSDRDGRFTLPQIKAATYHLKAKASNFADTEVKDIVVGSQIDVQNIRVTLGGGGCIKGIALANDFSPRSGHMVQLMGDNGMFMGTTDEDGRFEICSIPAGSYMLMVTDIETLADDAGNFAFENRRPATVEIVDGETTEIELAPPENGVELTGVIRGEIPDMTMISLQKSNLPSFEDMDPDDMADMDLTSMMEFAPHTTAIHPDGRFNFGPVEPGDYLLQVQSMGEMNMETEMELDMELEAALESGEDFDMTAFMPGVLVSKELTLEEGKPLHLELELP